MEKLLLELFHNGFDINIDLIQGYYKLTLYDKVQNKILASQKADTPEKALAIIMRDNFIKPTYEGLSKL